MIAFVYAGQGSQKVGMGMDFYETYKTVQNCFDNISLDFNIKEIMFQGPKDRLTETKYTQPCMAAFAAAITELFFAEGIRPNYVAGLSLGEYSALYASSVFDFEMLMSLVAYRGRVMQETTEGFDCSMSAILGLEEKKVQQAVDSAVSFGIVSIANLNCSGQIVIGGETKAVKKAELSAKELGAKRCMPLQVSGPFHTAMMEEASALLCSRLGKTVFQEMQIPVLFNVTGDCRQDGQTILDLLTAQIKSPVQFEKIIKRLERLSVDTVIEIGPGKVLSGFFKKTAPGITVHAVEDVASFQQALKLLKEA